MRYTSVCNLMYVDNVTVEKLSDTLVSADIVPDSLVRV